MSLLEKQLHFIASGHGHNMTWMPIDETDIKLMSPEMIKLRGIEDHFVLEKIQDYYFWFELINVVSNAVDSVNALTITRHGEGKYTASLGIVLQPNSDYILNIVTHNNYSHIQTVRSTHASKSKLSAEIVGTDSTGGSRGSQGAREPPFDTEFST